MKNNILIILIHFSILSSDKKTVNLDKIGDIFITKECKRNKCASCKVISFFSTVPRKVVVQSGATLDIGSLGRTVFFCGKTNLVIEAGGNLNFTGERLCMTGSTQMIFTPPALK
jgi:hypothetical protein